MSDNRIDPYQSARTTPVAPPVSVVARPQQRTVRRRQPRAEASTLRPAPTPPRRPPLPQPVFPSHDHIDETFDDDPRHDTEDEDHRASRSAATWFKRVTPDERHDPDAAWSLSDLASACPDPRLDTTARLDPYWSGSWTGSVPSWLTRDLAERQSESGLLNLPPRLMVDPTAALDRMTRTRDLTDSVTLLGSLHSWRTCSTEQLAALTGNADLLAPINVLTASAFSADLLDVAPNSSAIAAAQRFGRGMIVRPSNSSVFEQTVKQRLTWAEWLAVTGGQEWNAGTQADRHNLLATELGLRLAEYTDVATVLGERFSTVDLLAGSGVGLPALPATDRRSADLVAVRLDGLRIAIEVTATVSSHFNQKVEKWIRLLSETPLEESGLVVVFMIATPPDKAQSSSVRRVRSATYSAVARAVKKYPGTSLDRTANRVGIATWRDWFPDAHKVSDAFLSMRVDRPTGNGDGPGRWEPYDLMDLSRTPFLAKDPAALMAVVDNAGGLGQTPYWLRANTNPPTFIGDLLADAGLKAIPRPVSARPGRLTGRAHGHAIEANSSGWKVPQRLLGLAKRLNEPGRVHDLHRTDPAPNQTPFVGSIPGLGCDS